MPPCALSRWLACLALAAAGLLAADYDAPSPETGSALPADRPMVSPPPPTVPAAPATLPSTLLGPDTNSVAVTTGIPTESLAAMMESLDDRQKLGAGDKVLFRIIEDQDPPVSLTVTETGDLDIPYYGLVPASGRTCQELAREIKQLVEKDLYFRATVILGLAQINKQRTLGRVYVVGQVRKTGPIEISGNEDLTISKAILGAGGFGDFADKKKVRVVRAGRDDAAKRTIVVNVADIWEKGQIENDLKLEAEDLVYVPAKFVNF